MFTKPFLRKLGRIAGMSLLVILLAAFIESAQSVNIEVKVVDARTGKTIPGAEVQAIPEPLESCATKNEGTVKIELGIQKCTLRISKSGYKDTKILVNLPVDKTVIVKLTPSTGVVILGGPNKENYKITEDECGENDWQEVRIERFGGESGPFCLHWTWKNKPEDWCKWAVKIPAPVKLLDYKAGKLVIELRGKFPAKSPKVKFRKSGHSGCKLLKLSRFVSNENRRKMQNEFVRIEIPISKFGMDDDYLKRVNVVQFDVAWESTEGDLWIREVSLGKE